MQMDPAIFLPPEDSPPDAKDKTPGEKKMPRSCSVASGLRERVIDVLVVPPVHLRPLSLKVRSRDVR
jgi:hypothetical protein